MPKIKESDYDHVPRKSIAAKEKVTSGERKSTAATVRRQDRVRRKELKKEGKKQRPLQKMDVKEGARSRGLRGVPGPAPFKLPRSKRNSYLRYAGATSYQQNKIVERLKTRNKRLGTALEVAAGALAMVGGLKAARSADTKGEQKYARDRKYGTPARAMATRHALTIPGAKTNIFDKKKRR